MLPTNGSAISEGPTPWSIGSCFSFLSFVARRVARVSSDSYF